MWVGVKIVAANLESSKPPQLQPACKAENRARALQEAIVLNGGREPRPYTHA